MAFLEKFPGWKMICIFICGLVMMSRVQTADTSEKLCTGHPADIVFVLDSSNSIWQSDFRMQLTFVQNVVSLLPIGPGDGDFRIGVVIYSHLVRLQFHLNYYTDKATLKKAISRVPYLGGGTYTGDAISYVLKNMFQSGHGSRAKAAHIMVIITDGLSQNTTSTAVQASKARYYGTEMFAVGVGPGVDQNELKSIASNPDERYLFRVDDFSALDDIKERLALRACELPPQRDESDGRSDTGPEIILPTLPPQNCGGKPAEVFFLLDASSSIWRPDFDKQLEFVKQIIKIFDIGHTRTRVGLIAFSDNVHPVVMLDSYERKLDLVQVIDRVPYLTGGTNTAAAIRYMRNEGFLSGIARDHVAHVGIILTDGQSQDMEATKEQARLAHKEGVYLFAIGIGGNTDKTELRDIASDPDDNFVFMLDNYDALTSIRDILAIKTCDISPTQLPPPQQDAVCTGRQPADVIFGVDTVHLGAKKTELILEFIAELVKGMNIGSDKIRTGLLTDNCPSISDIELSKHYSKHSFIKEVRTMRMPGMRSLLRKVRDYAFSNSRGGREEVTHRAIVFVDDKLDKHGHALREAQRVKFKNIELFVIAIGPRVDMDEIGAMCSVSVKQHVVRVPHYDSLSAMKGEVLRKLCDGL